MTGGCEEWPECANMGFVGPDCTCMCPTGLGGWDCTDVKASTAGRSTSRFWALGWMWITVGMFPWGIRGQSWEQ